MARDGNRPTRRFITWGRERRGENPRSNCNRPKSSLIGPEVETPRAEELKSTDHNIAKATPPLRNTYLLIHHVSFLSDLGTPAQETGTMMLFGLGNLLYGKPRMPPQFQNLVADPSSLHPPRQRRRNPIRRPFSRAQYSPPLPEPFITMAAVQAI